MAEAKDQFWRGAATDVLAGSLLGASLLGEDDRRLARRIRSANISQYHAVVHGSYPSDHDAPYVFAGVSDPKAMAEDTRRSVYAVVSSQILGPFRYEYSTGTRGFIDLHDFVRSWGTLYVTISWERAESLQPLVAAFVEAVVSAWRRMRPSDGRTLLLALDEVANVAPLPNLPKMITPVLAMASNACSACKNRAKPPAGAQRPTWSRADPPPASDIPRSAYGLLE